jgi:hypothetical protein
VTCENGAPHSGKPPLQRLVEWGDIRWLRVL